jgi:hypothetical protein
MATGLDLSALQGIDVHAHVESDGHQVSGRGESHPPALAEPGVRVSPHRAPTGRPWVRAMRCQWTKSLGWR